MEGAAGAVSGVCTHGRGVGWVGGELNMQSGGSAGMIEWHDPWVWDVYSFVPCLDGCITGCCIHRLTFRFHV